MPVPVLNKPPGESPDRPDELARLPHGRHGLPPEFVAHNQRERLIASFTALVAEVGYNDATITATTEGAGVSSRTFYKYFDTIEDCCVAAFDVALRHFDEATRDAFESQAEWPQRVRAGLAAALAFFAADPAAAHLLVVEPFVAGEAIAARYKEAIERDVPCLQGGRELRRPDAMPLPETTEKGLLGAMAGLISRQVKAGAADRLEDLLPDLTQFALTPYLGAVEARNVAVSN